MNPLYKPLYPSEGGPPLAFACSVSEQKCAVTKTQRGMRIHLLRIHKLKEQIELPFIVAEKEILEWDYDCSICRRPVYMGKPHDHVCE